MKDELKDKKILITGGAGFIGTALANRLSKNNKVILFDNFRRGTKNVMKFVNKKNTVLVEGDVTKPEDVDKAVNNAEIIYHLAAVAGIHTVTEKPVETIEINFYGTKNILEAARKHDIKRFLFSSTSEVYGPYAFNASEEDPTSQGPLSEVRWYYATSKLAAENLVHAYYRQYGLKITTTRFFNIYGPNQLGEGAIGNFIKNAIVNKPLEIFGDGGQIRAWCYISDCIEGSILSYNKNVIGHSVNIGNPFEPISIFNLAKKIKSITNSKSKIKFIEKFSKKGDVFLRVPNIEKIKKLTGYQPKINLDEGLKRTISFFKSVNKNGI